MSIDSRDKRSSALSIGFVLSLPLPNSDIDQGDRQSVASIYRGILAAIPAPIGIGFLTGSLSIENSISGSLSIFNSLSGELTINDVNN